MVVEPNPTTIDPYSHYDGQAGPTTTTKAEHFYSGTELGCPSTVARELYWLSIAARELNWVGRARLLEKLDWLSTTARELNWAGEALLLES
ncbi:hypothetical protein B296_00047037 [Ensete ventricosum]|uniref:Uncharacterized protein n=1 Tax=Ensete ventricosum TaxID=4639 RepID=A0A426YV90_ENSVE|nr:hypothetical protein B296_00047037 [Ensete ventricosum]